MSDENGHQRRLIWSATTALAAHNGRAPHCRLDVTCIADELCVPNAEVALTGFPVAEDGRRRSAHTHNSVTLRYSISLLSKIKLENLSNSRVHQYRLVQLDVICK